MKAILLILSLTANLAFGADFSCRESVDPNAHEYVDEKHTFEAITDYTLNSYQKINRSLRNDSAYGWTLNQARLICIGLSKLPLYEGKSYRVGRLPEELIQYYVSNKGKVITEKAFLSSSSANFGSFVFTYMLQMEPNIKFIIKSKNGRKIKEHSEFKLEFEVLYPAGSKFLITKVRPAKNPDGVTKIWMTQVE